MESPHHPQVWLLIGKESEQTHSLSCEISEGDLVHTWPETVWCLMHPNWSLSPRKKCSWPMSIIKNLSCRILLNATIVEVEHPVSTNMDDLHILLPKSIILFNPLLPFPQQNGGSDTKILCRDNIEIHRICGKQRLPLSLHNWIQLLQFDIGLLNYRVEILNLFLHSLIGLIPPIKKFFGFPNLCELLLLHNGIGECLGLLVRLFDLRLEFLHWVFLVF